METLHMRIVQSVCIFYAEAIYTLRKAGAGIKNRGMEWLRKFACKEDFDLDEHASGCRHDPKKLQIRSMEETYSTVIVGGIQRVNAKIEEMERAAHMYDKEYKVDSMGHDMCHNSLMITCDLCGKTGLVSWESQKRSNPSALEGFKHPQEYYLYLAATVRFLRTDFVCEDWPCKEDVSMKRKREDGDMIKMSRIYDALLNKKMRKQELPKMSASDSMDASGSEGSMDMEKIEMESESDASESVCVESD
jgi:hypothetical protein